MKHILLCDCFVINVDLHVLTFCKRFFKYFCSCHSDEDHNCPNGHQPLLVLYFYFCLWDSQRVPHVSFGNCHILPTKFLPTRSVIIKHGLTICNSSIEFYKCQEIFHKIFIKFHKNFKHFTRDFDTILSMVVVIILNRFNNLQVYLIF